MNALVEFTQKLENSTDLVHDEKGALLPPDTLYEWLEAAKHISKMCKEYEAQLKEAVQKSGPLQLETLPELAIAIVESDGRTSINAEKAMPVLYDYFEPSEVAPFVTIQKGKMEKALMDKTEAGSKKGMVDMLQYKLEQAGAIEKGKPSHQLQVIQRR